MWHLPVKPAGLSWVLYIYSISPRGSREKSALGWAWARLHYQPGPTCLSAGGRLKARR